MLERAIELFDALGIVGQSTGIEVGGDFQANIGGPADALHNKCGIDFAIVPPAELVVAQLLNGQGSDTNIVNRLPVFVEQTRILGNLSAQGVDIRRVQVAGEHTRMEVTVGALGLAERNLYVHAEPHGQLKL